MKYLKCKWPLNSSLLLFFLCFALNGLAQVYNPRTFEKNIKGFDRRDSLEKTQAGSNLFVGSSSITNWKDVASYFPEAYVINRGFGGSKFEDLLFFADRTIMKYKPAKIFIYEGDNDIAGGVSIEVMLKQAKELREKIAKELPNVPVVFISVKPSVARWHLKDKYEDLNRQLKKYCKKTKNTQFADVWSPMLDEKGEVFKHVFLEDNLHMKPEGYAIWEKVLKPFVINNKRL
jgi:lysophospholipase L1-like esterase